MGQSTWGVTKMLAKVLSLLGLSVGLTLSQDTYSCPDGWVISDVGGVVDCILLGGFNEMVTKQDAEIICSFHDAWLVDLDEGHGGQKNRFIANLINEEQNQPRTLDFSQAESMTPVQELVLSPGQLNGDEIQLKFVKFQDVQNIQFFIQDNQSGDEITQITRLDLFGTPKQTTNMKDLKKSG